MDPILILLLLELLKRRGSSPGLPAPELEPPNVNPPFTVAPAPAPGAPAPGPFQIQPRTAVPGPMPGAFPAAAPPLMFPTGAASFGVAPVEETIEAGSQDRTPIEPFAMVRRRKRARFGSPFLSAFGPLGDTQGATGQGGLSDFGSPQG